MAVGAFGVLRHREFAIVWTAMVVSDLGTWMQIAALGIFAVEATGHATWVGILTTVTYVSSGLLAPLGGAAADRHDRRRVIALAALLEAFVALLLWTGLVAGLRSLPVIATLAAVQGAAFGYLSPALWSLIPDLVPRREVAQATSLVHVSWNSGRALGPVLAVAALAVTSYAGVFLINGASFVFIAAAMTKVSPRPHRHSDDGSMGQQLRAGLAALVTTAACRWPAALAIAEMVLVAPFIAFIPVMAQLVLGGGPADSARLFAAQGIGSAVGVVLIASLIPRLGQERILLGSVIAVGALGVGYAFSGSIAVAMVVILPLSAAHTSTLVGATALLQRDAPVRVRGRVISMYLALTTVGRGISSELQGPAIDHAGLRVVLAACSCTLLVVGLAVSVPIARHLAAATTPRSNVDPGST